MVLKLHQNQEFIEKYMKRNSSQMDADPTPPKEKTHRETNNHRYTSLLPFKGYLFYEPVPETVSQLAVQR